MRVRVLVLALIVVASSCARSKKMSPPNAVQQQNKISGFAKLPPLTRLEASAIAQSVNTVDKWKNPFLVIRPEGIEFDTGGGTDGDHIVSISNLREALTDLPPEAWPLGRIVAVQEIGIRSGQQKDNEAIARNREAVREILESLKIAANWWPSA